MSYISPVHSEADACKGTPWFPRQPVPESMHLHSARSQGQDRRSVHPETELADDEAMFLLKKVATAYP